MNKDAAAWLALRIIGLLALGRTVLAMIDVVVNVFDLWKLYGVTYEALASQTQRLILQAWIGTGIASVQCIFFAFVAFYFLRKGKAMHKLLVHESA